MANKPIEVRVTIVLPDLPQRSHSDVRVLTPSVPAPEPDARLTRLPAQPDDTPAGYVWAGTNFGLVPYSGPKPQAGDLIAVVGNRASRYVTSPLAAEPQRWPTFNGGCRCNCPGSSGIVIYSTSCRSVVNLIALDAQTGDVFQFFGMNELGGIGGVFNNSFQSIPVAIGQTAPYDLWVVDDRRFWQQRRLDSQLSPVRGYFTLVRYALSGGQYVPLSYVNLIDPGSSGVTENDPPALETNFLSVVTGLPCITLQKAPSRFLVIDGVTITTRTLTLDDVPYNRGLRGPIVTVPQRPGRSALHYVVATIGSAFELVEFNDADVITQVLPLIGLSFPFHPTAFCNRILILNGSADEEDA